MRSDPDYGTLSHRRLDDMDQGEDVEGAERKEDPLDFALWKAHKQGEDTFWESPWGPGRPGWHIECSAMAEELLGVGFDIHGGGSDLLFPHHENEAAQTRAARGEELARIWMHNGMIQATGEKMAKSVGNIAPLHEVIERYGPRRGRDVSASAVTTASRWRSPRPRWSRPRPTSCAYARPRAGSRPGPSPSDLDELRGRFFDALANDFNTAEALAIISTNGSARRPARDRRRRATRTCARCSACWDSSGLLGAARAGAREDVRGAGAEARAGAGRARLRRRRPPAR